jgi:hypothetical protein
LASAMARLSDLSFAPGAVPGKERNAAMLSPATPSGTATNKKIDHFRDSKKRENDLRRIR